MFRITRNGEEVFQIENLALKGRKSFRIKEKIKMVQEAKTAVILNQVKEAGIPMDEFQQLVREQSQKKTREEYKQELSSLLAKAEIGEVGVQDQIKKIQAKIIIIDYGVELEELEDMYESGKDSLSEEEQERLSSRIENLKAEIQQATIDSVDEKAIDLGIGIKSVVSSKIIKIKEDQLKLEEEVTQAIFDYFGKSKAFFEEEMTLEEMRALIDAVQKANPDQPDFLK